MDTKSDLLLIEGKRNTAQLYYSTFILKGYKVWLAGNSKEAETICTDNKPDVIIVNLPSFRSSGTRLLSQLCHRHPDLPLIVLADGDRKALLPKSGQRVVLAPVTLQKLINAITRMHPAESKNLLTVSNVKLDLMNNWVQVDSRKVQLTPQLVLLLSTLMAKPGEIIERETIFKRVWETDYTADMRTLDVHISWLRRAIEKDARNPRYIKTVRGVGYYFDPYARQ